MCESAEQHARRHYVGLEPSIHRLNPAHEFWVGACVGGSMAGRVGCSTAGELGETGLQRAAHVKLHGDKRFMRTLQDCWLETEAEDEHHRTRFLPSTAFTLIEFWLGCVRYRTAGSVGGSKTGRVGAHGEEGGGRGH